jgi:hypothetical protein
MAFDGFAIVADERDTQKKATLIDRTNGSYIRFDVTNNEVLLSAANDFSRTVNHDESDTVLNDKTTNVTKNESTTVGETSSLTAKKRTVTTTGDDERTVGGAWKITVVGKAEISAQDNVEISSAKEAIVNAGNGQKVELNVGAQTVLQGQVASALIDGASEVKIGRLATEGLIKGSGQGIYDGHTHIVVVAGAPITSSPPTPLMTPGVVTTKAKGE